MSHLKRLAAPKTWPIKRKQSSFITRPSPGPHNLVSSMPIDFILRELLEFAKTKREINKVLNERKILVNNTAIKEKNHPVGIFDTISIPATGDYFRLLFSRLGKFILHKTTKTDAEIKYLRIKNKKILKGGKIQLNFSDGTNMVTEKKDYKVGDTLIVHGKELMKHLKFEKGALIYLISGKHIGKTGTLHEVLSFKGSQQDRIVLKGKEGNIDTLKEYAFVIEKEFKDE
ncbi:MAG TPA: 30S ribosomal protein S4e [Candidatus Nanoarchaeia archaeon]|nr:30S ribosomal protein S4e [Candidatus Nanoarchaeia archaeon]